MTETSQQHEQTPPPYAPPPPPPYAGPYTGPFPGLAHKKLMRTPDDKMVAGVCGGVARYLGVDPTLVRVAAVVALVVGFPAAAIAYVVAWAIMPVSG